VDLLLLKLGAKAMDSDVQAAKHVERLRDFYTPTVTGGGGARTELARGNDDARPGRDDFGRSAEIEADRRQPLRHRLDDQSAAFLAHGILATKPELAGNLFARMRPFQNSPTCSLGVACVSIRLSENTYPTGSTVHREKRPWAQHSTGPGGPPDRIQNG
jgi:hypothetical protein